MFKAAEESSNRNKLDFYPGELHFRRLLDRLPAAAYTCDAEGLITYFNQRAEAVWGRTPKLNDHADRFCGSHRLYSSDGAPIAHDQCWMALALKGKEYSGCEIVVERPDGSRVTVLTYASPIFDDSGRVLGAVNVVIDISERRRAEELLKEADRHKNEFLAILSHELRTPLAPIRNALQVLSLKSPPDPELQNVLGLIDRQIRQMTRLVDDLLDISRIIRRQLELRKEHVGLSEVVYAAVEASQPMLELYGQTFTFSVPSEPVYLDADRARLAQVISNLLNNAAKYTGADGSITLKAERQGEEAVISVRASIRVNPVATAQAGAMRMGGKPTAFGFDEEDIEQVIAAVMKAGQIELAGVHLFVGTQILDAGALVEQWRHGIGVAAKVAARIGRPLKTIDLGGGLGIPYFPGERALDLARVAAEVAALKALQKADPLLADARVVVEPGRYLVGPAGVYVVEVNSVKHSRGTRFVVTDGGMNHHLAASGNLGQVIKRDYPIVAPARMDADSRSPATVCGPLCTPLDTLARSASLPELAAGDLVAVLQSGAYGLTASPGRFLSHPAATEVLVEDGKVQIIASA